MDFKCIPSLRLRTPHLSRSRSRRNVHKSHIIEKNTMKICAIIGASWVELKLDENEAAESPRQKYFVYPATSKKNEIVHEIHTFNEDSWITFLPEFISLRCLKDPCVLFEGLWRKRCKISVKGASTEQERNVCSAGNGEHREDIDCRRNTPRIFSLKLCPETTMFN